MTKSPENEHLPKHVAIIMDGNGRWAKQRGLPRGEGHKQGTTPVVRMTSAVRVQTTMVSANTSNTPHMP